VKEYEKVAQSFTRQPGVDESTNLLRDLMKSG